MDDSHRLTITDGRVDAIREVTDGDVDSWDSGGNATYWSVNRDVTLIRNHFDDEPELDPVPPVRVPTSTLENLILAWRAARFGRGALRIYPRQGLEDPDPEPV
jgi:hypothetical protein